MNLYEIAAIEDEIDAIAKANDGEISEEQFQALIEAQTQAPAKIDNLVKYIRHLELGINTCQLEEARIKAMRDRADRRIKSIKKYLTPYVQKKGKVETGTFNLSTRKSESVQLSDDFNDKKYMTEVVIVKPIKDKIKQALKSGEEIPGASIKTNYNLQVK